MRLPLFCCTLVLILAGCGSVNVQTQFNESASFSSLKTYAWLQTDELPGDNVRVNNPVVADFVRDAVEKKLQKKGYRKQETGDVDFFVTWFGAIESKVKVSSIDHFYNTTGYGPVAATMPVKMQESASVREYEEGSILIDILDPKSHEPLWRGMGKEKLLKGMSEIEVGLYINKVVSQIMDQFPPGEK